MDSTVSVSKGCFVFKNGATRADKSVKKTRKRKTVSASVHLLGKEVTEQPFYQAYLSNLKCLERDVEELNKESYCRTIEDLIEYIADERGEQANEIEGISGIIPTAALLTGINQPDHINRFNSISERIQETVSAASVCILQSRDCLNLKTAIETMVYEFVETPYEDEEDRDRKRLRKSQCTMKQLRTWHQAKYSNKRHVLVIILADFECFSSQVLQDLILILSSYCESLPLALVLGVATSISAIHTTLSYHVTSKIKLRVFQTLAAPVGLNLVLEKVILSPKYPFHLSGKCIKFLTHIFLYYDFSLNSFIQGFKYCLMEHFFQGNAYALCVSYTQGLKNIRYLSHDDIESLRKMLSFRPYVESINDCKKIIGILTDDEYFKKKLPQLLKDCHLYYIRFRVFVEFLYIFVEDIPKSPLGKIPREIYMLALAKELNQEIGFKESWQLLSLTSKEEFLTKCSKAVFHTKEYLKEALPSDELGEECISDVHKVLEKLEKHLDLIKKAGIENRKEQQSKVTSSDEIKNLTSRHDLKEHLTKLSKQEKPKSEFNKALAETLDFIEKEIVMKYLAPLQRAPPLHEIFTFSDINTIRRNIIGIPRAALHMALNNPNFYLQCKCCATTDNSQLIATMPDLSIAYKLHLECGRMINLFDWLQAFRSLVDFNEEEQEQINPQTQARFTRAVAELQFLGYIKMSKRKTDHASRLTW